MADVRVTFSKTDRAKYISHLDLNRAMQRAIKRAGIHVWYTEGFNPHAYIMFPLALSLGVDSKCELMDFTVVDDMDFEEIKISRNNVLPDGLKVSKVALQVKSHKDIAKSEYKLCIRTDISAENTLEKFNEFLNFEKIEIEKRTKKKGINLVDIKPFIEVIDKKISGEDFVLTLHLPAGTQTNINPSLVTDAFQMLTGVVITSVSTERTKILCDNDEIFS